MENTKQPKYQNVSVKLTGADGNAFMILGLCQKSARKAGLTKDQIDEFINEASSGDYDHLLQTCFKYFDIE